MVDQKELTSTGARKNRIFKVANLKANAPEGGTPNAEKKGAVVPAQPAKQKFAAPRNLGGKLTDAIRAVLAAWKPESFTRDELQQRVIKQFPEHAEKHGAIATNLLDMVERCELSREGYGSSAVYKVVGLKTKDPIPVPERKPAASGPTAKEEAWREMRGTISVPRDADAGTYPED